TLAERAAVRLLADEADPSRFVLARNLLDSLAVEVAAAQIAGAGRRAIRRVRDPDPLPQHLELLARRVQPRREAGSVQQPPEVVARVREVRLRSRRHTP